MKDRLNLPPARLSRRHLLAALGTGAGALALGLLAQRKASANQFPDHLVRIVVAGPAGGGTDFVARLLADRLSQHWRLSVVVDNRAGASGVIGTRFVQQAAPDGYTLILGQAGTHAIVPALQHPTPYDPIRDFTPIVEVSDAPDLLVVSADSAIRDFRGLIDAARAQPGGATFGSAGIGLPQHLIGVRMAQLSGVQMRHIPYKGSPPGLTDLMGGQITSMVVTAAAAIPFIKAGRIRAIATDAPQRLPSQPEVPTFTDLGMPTLQAGGWNGLFAPAGTPRNVVNEINVAVCQVLTDNAVRTSLANSYVTPVGGTPEAFAAFQRAEVRRWAAIIKQTGVQV